MTSKRPRSRALIVLLAASFAAATVVGCIVEGGTIGGGQNPYYDDEVEYFPPESQPVDVREFETHDEAEKETPPLDEAESDSEVRDP